MKIIIALVAVVALGGIAYFTLTNMNSDTYQPAPATETGMPIVPMAEPMPITTTDTTTTTTTTATTGKIVIVNYQNNSFDPKTININVGDIVTFTNESTSTIRIASDPHPFHTSYPTLDSGTLQPDKSYSIAFGGAVTVNYHNHFSPGVGGTIIVR